MCPDARHETDWIPEPLFHLPSGSRLYVCGAGGKTTLIHVLASFYLARGRKTAVTTTTHMMREAPLCTSVRAAAEALRTDGYAFAGRLDPVHPEKICSLPEEERKELAGEADLILTEADGARHMPFKVPYPWEPVVDPWATDIVIVYGLRAAGMRIRESCYHPDGVAELLAGRFPEAAEKGTETRLSEEMLRYAVEKAYLMPLRARFPDAHLLTAAAHRRENSTCFT